MKRIISLMLSVIMIFSLMPTTAFAATVQQTGYIGNKQDFKWTLYSDGELKIEGSGNVTYWSGKEPWASYKSQIKTVTLAEGITNFNTHMNLVTADVETINIPSTFKESAYASSPWLTNFINVTPSLKTVNVADGNINYASVDDILTDRAKTKVIRCPINYQGNITDALNDWNANITTIGQGAFYDCNYSSPIELFNIETLESNAFAFMPNLQWIVLNDVKNFGNNIFTGCTKLANIEFSGDAPTFTDYSFSGNTFTISYPGMNSTWSNVVTKTYGGTIKWEPLYETIAEGTIDKTGWKLTEDGTLTVSGNGAMTDFSNYNQTPWYSNRNSIKKVVVNNGITHIGTYAFTYLTKVENVELPETLLSIGKGAFGECDALTSIVIPDGVTTIGYDAFKSCDSLSKVKIPASVTDMGTSCFSTTNLKTAGPIGGNYDVEFGWTTAIPADAFYNAKTIESIVLPDTITTIGSDAFRGCSSLKTIDFPEGVSILPEDLFGNCTSLSSVTIPNSVTKIEAYAFSTCTSLETIDYAGSPSQWNAIEKRSNWDINAGTYTIYYGKFDVIAGQCENGTVVVDKEITESGEIVTVTATPDEGYELKGIYLDGVLLSGNSFTVNNNHTVTAEFVKTVTNIEVPVNNTACEAGATITAPEGGWKEGENTFTVSAEIPCVVLVSHDGGQTYTRISATATGTAGTYSFTADITAGTQVAVAVAGDFNKDGEISVADITRLKAAYREKVVADGVQTVIGDINGDGEISVADITRLKAAYRGKITLAW